MDSQEARNAAVAVGCGLILFLHYVIDVSGATEGLFLSGFTLSSNF